MVHSAKENIAIEQIAAAGVGIWKMATTLGMAHSRRIVPHTDRAQKKNVINTSFTYLSMVLFTDTSSTTHTDNTNLPEMPLSRVLKSARGFFFFFLNVPQMAKRKKTGPTLKNAFHNFPEERGDSFKNHPSNNLCCCRPRVFFRFSYIQIFVFFDLPERALTKKKAHVQDPTSNKPSPESIATVKEPIQFPTLFAVLVMSCIHGIPSLPVSFVIEHHFSLCHYCDVVLLVEILLLSVEVDLNFGSSGCCATGGSSSISRHLLFFLNQSCQVLM